MPVAVRVEDLLHRMTMHEKVMQMVQYTLGTNNIENNKGVEVKNIPAETGSLIYFGTEPTLRHNMQRHAMAFRLRRDTRFPHNIPHSAGSGVQLQPPSYAPFVPRKRSGGAHVGRRLDVLAHD